MSSSEEAFSLLKKWKTEKSPIKLLVTLRSGGGVLSGVVREVTSSSVCFATGGSGELLLSFVGSRFEYGDVREAPLELRDKPIEGFLLVVTPSGDRFLFFELRTPDSPSGEARGNDSD